MSFTGMRYPGPPPHLGFVAGRYRDGARSDIWTDVTRCALGTFVRLVPACDCGWHGADVPATWDGFRACERAWVEDHLQSILADGQWGRLTSICAPAAGG